MREPVLQQFLLEQIRQHPGQLVPSTVAAAAWAAERELEPLSSRQWTTLRNSIRRATAALIRKGQIGWAELEAPVGELGHKRYLLCMTEPGIVVTPQLHENARRLLSSTRLPAAG